MKYKKCKECNSIIYKNNNIFCNRSCSAKYNNKNRILSEETKLKISNSLKKDPHIKFCEGCKENFKTKRKNKKFCSRSCSARFNNKLNRDRLSKISSERAKERHRNKDTSFGWQRRDNLTPSYPESIAIRFFENNDIVFKREVKIDKYFVDFIVNNIAVEIDGQQHLLPERAASDRSKDEILKQKGYIVHRIKYPDDNITERLSELFIKK